jgi:toxin-antitoxin system PIN domain toxin
VVVVDANVLLYAVDTASAHHERSRSWLDASLAAAEAIGLAWAVVLAFIRIGTNASILPTPMTVDEASGQVETWLSAPAAVVTEPTTRHPALLRGLLRETGTAGNLTTDVHLAALAIEHGADIVSWNRDFRPLPGGPPPTPGLTASSRDYAPASAPPPSNRSRRRKRAARWARLSSRNSRRWARISSASSPSAAVPASRRRTMASVARSWRRVSSRMNTRASSSTCPIVSRAR